MIETIAAKPETIWEKRSAAVAAGANVAIATDNWREYDSTCPGGMGNGIIRRGQSLILMPELGQGHGKCWRFTEEKWRIFEANGCRFHRMIEKDALELARRSASEGERFCGAIAKNGKLANAGSGKVLNGAFVDCLVKAGVLAAKGVFEPAVEREVVAAQTVAVFGNGRKMRVVALFVCPIDATGRHVAADSRVLQAAHAFARRVAVEFGQAKNTYVVAASPTGWEKSVRPLEDAAMEDVLLSLDAQAWRVVGDLPRDAKGRVMWKLFPETERQLETRLKTALAAEAESGLWVDKHAGDALEILGLPPSGIELARRLLNRIAGAEEEFWYVDWDKSVNEHCLAKGRRPDFVKAGMRFPEQSGFWARLARLIGR